MRQQNNDMFSILLNALVKTGDAALALQFQHAMFKELWLKSQEREKLVEDTADRVISRLSINIDATDVLSKIDELDTAISKLAK